LNVWQTLIVEQTFFDRAALVIWDIRYLLIKQQLCLFFPFKVSSSLIDATIAGNTLLALRDLSFQGINKHSVNARRAR